MKTNNLELIPVDFDPFASAPILTINTTEPQIEIFLACLLGGEEANKAYNESVRLELSGSFSQVALYKALTALIKRHESLRSTFSADGKQMFIFEELPLQFFYKDLSKEKNVDQENYIKDFIAKNAEQSFNLLSGPLFRVALIKTNEEVHHLILTAHHLICDGWSLGVILEELSQLYSAFITYTTPVLPEAPLYSNFAEEQNLFYNTNEYRSIQQFWMEQYNKNIPELSLPLDYSRPKKRTYKAQRADFPLNKNLVNSLKKVGAEQGCSFVTTLLAAFQIYLHKISGQESIVLGLPAAGQAASACYGLVGHCVNLLPIKSTLNKDISFVEYIKHQKTYLLDAYEHQQFTFSSLLKKLHVPRNPSKIPLVPVVFNIDAGMDTKVKFHQLKHTLVSNPRAYENFELFLNLNNCGDDYILEWSYNTQLFQASTINKMMDEFESVISLIVEQPTTSISCIQLLKKTLDLEGSTQTTVLSDILPQTVAHCFSKQASLFSNKIAISDHSNSLTYEALERFSNQFAHFLIEEGIQPKQIVGLAVDRSSDILIYLLGILKAGAVYLPLDTSYPKERIEFMLNDSGAACLITNSTYKGKYTCKGSEFVTEEIGLVLPNYKTTFPQVEVQDTDLAYVLYTSGSTGKPKGVMIRHFNLMNVLLSVQNSFGITKSDLFLGVSSISFDISGIDFFLPLISGASVHLVSFECAKDGWALLDEIKLIKPTFMQATPSTWQMLLEVGLEKDTLINTICSTGEALPKGLAQKLLPCSNHLYNMYGPTETTIWSAIKRVNLNDTIITIGRPIDQTELYILNDNLQPVEEGSIGEIYIGGKGVASGYLNRPALTAERFIDNPFNGTSSSKIYRTGDLGKVLPNGEIQCLGRIDHQVKIRGFRIELEEIEHSLNSCTYIKQAVVMSREDAPGNQRLVAYLITKENLEKNIIVDACKKTVKNSLPSYMWPNDYMILSELPLTPNGKVDRNALPLPQNNLIDSDAEADSVTEEESMVLKIWQEVLGLKDIGLNDDFFELGGHSMIAVQMITKLKQQTGIRLPLAVLVEYTTVSELASFLMQHQK